MLRSQNSLDNKDSKIQFYPAFLIPKGVLMITVVQDNIRVQVLTENILRVEYSANGTFEDRPTYFVPDRQFANDAQAFVQYNFKNVNILFGNYNLIIPKKATSIAGVNLSKNGIKIYSCMPMKNSGELPPLWDTPEVFAVADNPRIVFSENSCEYSLEEDVQDVYLLLCQKDFKLLRRLFVTLCGRNELVRLSTLGYWNSKYYEYTQQTAMQNIADHRLHGIPLDNMVVDTDWRKSHSGTGYEINTKLFPDMKAFLRSAHASNVEITFNDHPEPLAEAKSCLDPVEQEFRQEKLTSLLNLGVDCLWYDRNWMTHLVSPTPNVHAESLGMYIYHKATRKKFIADSHSKNIFRRPVILANVDDVHNGNYLGINDSASHSYSVQWTGDIGSDYGDLYKEIVSLVRGGNNCVPYINADCGGHTGNPDKHQFVRWNQFCALSPIYRPHCTKSVSRTREPWQYDAETEQIVKNYISMRYNLLPIIYKNAFENYLSGEPIFKSLAFCYPQDKRAQRCNTQYMLGNNILVAPYYKDVAMVVEAQRYTTPVSCTYFNGTKWEGKPLAKAAYDAVDFYWNHVSPEKGVPAYDFSATFKATLQFDCNVELLVESDDGCTVTVDGVTVLEDKTEHALMTHSLGFLQQNQPHDVEINYFQAGGEAAIRLLYRPQVKEEKFPVYLPEGEWLDVFDGRMYKGGKTFYKKNLPLEAMPLYVRVGAVLPLAKATNTKQQRWNKLTLDIYPSKTALEQGYIYEDDATTTAYRQGQFKISKFSTTFANNRYVLVLNKSQGTFKGTRNYQQREITLKYHMLKGMENVTEVVCNGQSVPFKVYFKRKAAFPFNDGTRDRNGKTLVAKVQLDCNRDNQIEFVLQ